MPRVVKYWLESKCKYTAQVKNSQYQKPLGVTTDTKQSFNTHIQQIYGKARAKLKALTRIAPFMNMEKKILMNTFFNVQFSYGPITWMFHSRKLSHKNKLWKLVPTNLKSLSSVTSFSNAINRTRAIVHVAYIF